MNQESKEKNQINRHAEKSLYAGYSGRTGFTPTPRHPELDSGSRRFMKKEEALNKSSFRAPLRSGFTLIELLVVVLIIGILAAVVLPQYQLAVIKARVAKMLPLMKAIATAEEAYFLENGVYTDRNNKLNVVLPSVCELANGGNASIANHWICDNDFLIDFSGQNSVRLLYCPSNNLTLTDCNASVEFQVVFVYQHPKDAQYQSVAGKIRCVGNTKMCNLLKI